MNRVLITGGAGFLGPHLCDCLLRDGHDVLCVDNFFTGSKANIAHVIGNPYCTYRVGSERPMGSVVTSTHGPTNYEMLYASASAR
jgi:nucleoside-diphosphate-sugar epimerase